MHYGRIYLATQFRVCDCLLSRLTVPFRTYACFQNVTYSTAMIKLIRALNQNILCFSILNIFSGWNRACLIGSKAFVLKKEDVHLKTKSSAHVQVLLLLKFNNVSPYQDFVFNLYI